MLSHEHCVGSVEGAMYWCCEDGNEHLGAETPEAVADVEDFV